MFMRNRAHMCAMCNTADQAHHKRHRDLAERLRSIYEICGKDWSIVPSEDHERGRVRRTQFESFNNDRASEGVQPTKKDKKEEKRLFKATCRRRVITLDDIMYIESVLHPPSANGDAEGPRNTEEIEEIERHLRYNAQVYNTGFKRGVVKNFARIADVDVDFVGEMDRILDVLHVAQLLKWNTKNRGLLGKDLKIFGDLVAEFKERVVEDLLLLKKEEMEVKMRRASYLRYTNRASFDVLEERYATRDWKTGLKFSESPTVPSMSSGSISVLDEDYEEEDEGEDEESAVDWRQEASLSSLPSDSPDLRHLVHGHKRIGGGGKFEHAVSICRSPPRTSTKPQGISKRKLPLQIRIVPNIKQEIRDVTPDVTSVSVRSTAVRKRSSSSSSSPSASCKRLITDENGWQVVGRVSRKSRTLPKYLSSLGPPRQPAMEASVDDYKSPVVAGSSHPTQEAFVTPKKSRIQSATHSGQQESEHQLNNATQESVLPEVKLVSLNPQEHAKVGHPAVAQRKAEKKKQREAERKARRAAERDVTVGSEAAVDGERNAIDTGVKEVKDVDTTKSRVFYQDVGSQFFAESCLHSYTTTIIGTDTKEKARLEAASTQITDFQAMTPISIGKPVPFVSGKGNLVNIRASKISKESTVIEKSAPVTPPSTILHGKACSSMPGEATEHMKQGHSSDWIKYVRYLRVDGLSEPNLIPEHSCTHPDSCPFAISNTTDCPYHQPYCDSCDPRIEQSYVVCPMRGTYFEGPFNRARAQKVLAHFEANPLTKGKFMLIDDDMLSWLLSDKKRSECIPEHILNDMPTKLCFEVTGYSRGGKKGRLMRQTEDFRLLDYDNNDPKNIVSRKELRQIYEAFKTGSGGSEQICYCEQHKKKNDIVVECAFRYCKYRTFHRDCVERLGVDEVSTWYCPDCEETLGRIANIVLLEVELMRQGEQSYGPLAIDMLGDEAKMKSIGSSVCLHLVEGDDENNDEPKAKRNPLLDGVD
jgi:hypothetical protein